MITNSLNKFLETNRHLSYLDKKITIDFNKCKKFLKNNDDVFITKADKSQVTVIMDKEVYIDRMTEMLNDKTTYTLLNKDPVKRITTKLNDLIKTWRNNEIIDENTYKCLNCTNGNLPRCYGLPKVHKPGYPLRIIVSSVGSPLYNVAKFLHDILHESIKKPKSHIKDS